MSTAVSANVRVHRVEETTRGLPLALLLITGIGFVFRFVAAFRLPLELDEQNSLLAVQMVSERGIPILPSGVLDLHGAVLSYLLAPLERLGLGGIDDLLPLRIVSALVGTATIVVTFSLTQRVARSVLPALIAAGLIALDPLSIYWSGHVRMYAFAQLFAMLAILCFVRVIMLTSPADLTRRGGVANLAGLVLTFWLAVFSHLSAALLWPALVIVAVATFGRGLLGQQRGVSAALGLCLLAPLLLVGLTTVVGGGAGTRSTSEADWLPGLSFLGDHNVDLTQIVRPSLHGWMELFSDGPLAAIVPLVIVAFSGLLIGTYLFATDSDDVPAGQRRGLGAIIAVYWIPILLFAFFSPDPEARYFLFLQPIGYVIVGLGLGALATAMEPSRARRPRWTVMATMLGIALLLTLHSVAGAWVTGTRSESRAGDLRPALNYVKERQSPGEPIVVSAAPVSYLVLNGSEDLRFLPGDEESQRSQRYAQRVGDDEPVDYWIGMPAITAIEELCSVLSGHPGSWLALNQRWLERRSVTTGSLGDLIAGATVEEYAAAGAKVFRSQPIDRWSARANRACSAESE